MIMIEPPVLVFHYIAWGHYKIAVFNELFELLRSSGIRMDLVHVALTEPGRHELGAPPLDMHRCPYRVLLPTSYERTRWHKRAWLMAREIVRLRPMLVVLPGYFDPAYWIALAAAKTVGAKVGVMIDSTAYDRPRWAILERVKRTFVRACDGVFSYGSAAKCYALALGAPEKCVVVRCQATDNDEVTAAADLMRRRRDAVKGERQLAPWNFLYVGRLSREKNVQVALTALAALQQTQASARDWGLILVGHGPERPRLEALASSLALSGVVFVGGLSWREAASYYGLADVLVLPSISEPWGLVVNEAMTCGLPVIVSNRCGAAFDLVEEGVNGFTFDPARPETLVDVMARFVSGSLNLPAMGRESKRLVRPFTPHNAAQAMAAGVMRMLGLAQLTPPEGPEASVLKRAARPG